MSNIRNIPGTWLTFNDKDLLDGSHSEIKATTFTFLYFSPDTIWNPPLSAPFLVKYLLASLMVKGGFVFYILYAVQIL